MLAFLSGDVQAVKSKFRPLPGTAPWYKEATKSTWVKPDWPVDYVVPNFGQDKTIKESIKNMEAAEEQLKHKMQATFKPPKGHPIDYKVPNFGQDNDIKLTLDNLDQSEKDLKHKWTPDLSKKKPLPQDYFVPNFGVDTEIKTTQNSLNIAEKITKKKWNWRPPTKEEKAGFPKDYFVPNFGLDHDIKVTQANIAAQEKIHGKWTPKQDENGVWMVPSPINNNNYTYKSLVQLDAEVESDPICSSAGCNYNSEKPTKLGYPIDYFVPNFGKDREVRWTDSSLAWAEKNRGHVWNYIKPDKKPEADPDFRIPDFGLDEDVVWTQENIDNQQKVLGHEWKPVQDENGVWVVPTAFDNKSYTYAADKANVQLESETKREPLLTWKPKAPSSHPVDYFVPNFGKDHENVITTDNSLRVAEKIVGHKWNYTPPTKEQKAGHPVDYKVPNFGMDHDIMWT